MSTTSLLHLPCEVLLIIFKTLKPRDLRNLMLTCKSLRDFIKNSNSIWRLYCAKQLNIQNPPENRRHLPISLFNQCRISYNWKFGIYKSKVCIEHNMNYMPWLKYRNSKELFLSIGSELFCYATDQMGWPNPKDVFWKLNVPKVERNDVRTNDISRFVVKGDRIACGNRDGCVAVYKLHNNKSRRQTPTLIHHIKNCHENGQVEVTCVDMIDQKDTISVLTGSDCSRNLCFWSWNPALENKHNTSDGQVTCKKRFALPDSNGIKCLAVDTKGHRVAIGLDGNDQAVIIDINENKLLLSAKQMVSPRMAIRDITWHDENTIGYVTHSGLLEFIDVRIRKLIYVARDPFHSALYCLKTDGNYAALVGSSQHSRCVLFDKRSFRHVQIYFTQKKASPVYSLDFDSTKLIAAVDRSVAALHFNSNTRTDQRKDYSETFECIEMY